MVDKDHCGTPNAGCTRIEYRKNGRSGPWEIL